MPDNQATTEERLARVEAGLERLADALGEVLGVVKAAVDRTEHHPARLDRAEQVLGGLAGVVAQMANVMHTALPRR